MAKISAKERKMGMRVGETQKWWWWWWFEVVVAVAKFRRVV